jgi:hypothetical protein
VIQVPVRIDTDSPRRPTVTVLARVSFRAPVTVRPPSVVVGADVAGPVERVIEVQGAKGLRVVRVAPPAGMSAAAEPVSDTLWRVRVSLPAAGSGDLNFRAVPQGEADDSPASRDVVVPVYRFAP